MVLLRQSSVVLVGKRLICHRGWDKVHPQVNQRLFWPLFAYSFGTVDATSILSIRFHCGCFCSLHTIHYCSSEPYWPLIRSEVCSAMANYIFSQCDVQWNCFCMTPLYLMALWIRSGAINASVGGNSVVLTVLKALFWRHLWSLAVFLNFDRFDGFQRWMLKVKLMYFLFLVLP